jgi:hypothetical protein
MLEQLGFAIVASKAHGSLLGQLQFDQDNQTFFLQSPAMGPQGITGQRTFIFHGIEAEIIDAGRMQQELRILQRRRMREAQGETAVPKPAFTPPPRPIVPQIDPRDALIERLMRELDAEKNKPPFPSHPPEVITRPNVVTVTPLDSDTERLIEAELRSREERARTTASPREPWDPDPDAKSPLLAIGRSFVQGSSNNYYGTSEQAKAIDPNQIPQFYNDSQDNEVEGGM